MNLGLVGVQNRRTRDEDEFGSLRPERLALFPLVEPLVFSSVAGVRTSNDAEVGLDDVLRRLGCIVLVGVPRTRAYIAWRGPPQSRAKNMPESAVDWACCTTLFAWRMSLTNNC